MDASILWYDVPAIGIILGLVQLFKQVGFPNQYCGVLSLVLGLAGNIGIASYQHGDPVQALVMGAVVGLAGAGTWSTGKNVAQSKPAQEPDQANP